MVLGVRTSSASGFDNIISSLCCNPTLSPASTTLDQDQVDPDVHHLVQVVRLSGNRAISVLLSDGIMIALKPFHSNHRHSTQFYEK